MSTMFTGKQYGAYTGRIAAEGFEPSGKAIINLSAGNYFIEVLPRSFYYRSPANFSPVSETNKYGAATWLAGTSVVFLPKNDSAFELYSRPIQIDITSSTLAPTTLYPGVVWDGTNFCGVPAALTAGVGSSLIAYSTDFISWEYKDVGANLPVATYGGSVTPNAFTYNANVTNKYVFCVTTNLGAGSVWTSTDFTTWTSRSIPVTSLPGDGPKGVIINSNATNKYVLYTGAGNSNSLCYSTDGITWTQATFTFNGFLSGFVATNDTASTNEIYVYSANLTSGNNMLTSTDGVTWTSRSSGFAESGYGVVYFNNKYYFFHSSTNYSYSTNGVTWTTGTNLPVANFSSAKPIIFDNKLYVYGSTSPWYNVSTDGTTWTLEPIAGGAHLATDGTTLYWYSSSGTFNAGKLPAPLWYRIYAVNDSTPLA